MPTLIGGDDSVPIPLQAGFADHGPVLVLQIDAHIDWRDEAAGERYGYSSPIPKMPGLDISSPSCRSRHDRTKSQLTPT